MSRRLPSFEHVFVRHCSPDKRGDFEREKKLLHSGFDPITSVATSSPGPFDQYGDAHRWTVAIQDQRTNWIVLSSNVVSAKELYDSNCASRRAEVIWIRHDADSKDYDFHWTSARNQVVEFKSHADMESFFAQFRPSDSELASCFESNEPTEIFHSLIEFAELNVPADKIEATEGKIQVISGKLNRPKKIVGPYIIFKAYGFAEGENEASDRLEQAITNGEINAVKQALADGASLAMLPGYPFSPLESALYQRNENWRECAQILLDAGCSMFSADGNSLLFKACPHYISEEKAIAIIRFLIDNSADINVQDENGHTVLHKFCLNRSNAVVSFLLEQGADPTIKTKQGVNCIDAIRNLVQNSEGDCKRPEHADTLELLTGVPYELPEEDRPSEEVLAEVERFFLMANARNLKRALPKKVEVTPLESSPLQKCPLYEPWLKELTDLGFEVAGHMTLHFIMETRQTVLVNKELRFRATLNTANKDLTAEIAATTLDDQVIGTTNDPNADGDYPFLPEYLQTLTFPESAPCELVNQLKNAVGNVELQEIPTDSISEHVRERIDIFTAGVRERIKYHEQAKIVREDGTSPRYERIGVYIQPQPGDDLETCTSMRLVRIFSKNLSEYEQRCDGLNAHLAIHDAAYLAAFDHLEMAGALHEEDPIDKGVSIGIEFFKSFSKQPKSELNHWFVEPVKLLLALLSSRGNWDEFQLVANGLTKGFLNDRFRVSDAPPVALAEVLVMLINPFRKRRIKNSDDLLASIMESRSKRAQLIAQAALAIDQVDSDAFQQTFVESLKFSIKQKPREDQHFDLPRVVAWYETILWHIAKHRGLELQELAEQQQDWILTAPAITRESR